MMERLISRLTMKYERSLFTDVVNEKSVNIYIDGYGTEWMAQSKWGSRTKRK